jgi:hypothetical protein
MTSAPLARSSADTCALSHHWRHGMRCDPVIVGGAVISQQWAEGADGCWGAQAKDGVDLARDLLGVA